MRRRGRQQRARGRQGRRLAPILLFFVTSTTLYFISKYFADDFSPNKSPFTEGTPPTAPESTPVWPVHRDYEKDLLRKRRDRPNDRKSNSNLSSAKPHDIDQLISPTSGKGFSTHNSKFNKVRSSGIAWDKTRDDSDVIQLGVERSPPNGDVDDFLARRDQIPFNVQPEVNKPPDALKLVNISTNDGGGKEQPLPRDKGSRVTDDSGAKIVDSDDKPEDSEPPPKRERLPLQAEEKVSTFINAKGQPVNAEAKFVDINRKKIHPTFRHKSQKAVRVVDEDILFVIEKEDILRSKTQSKMKEDGELHIISTRAGIFDIIDNANEMQSPRTKMSQAGSIHQWLRVSQYWTVQDNLQWSDRFNTWKALDLDPSTTWLVERTLPLIIDFGASYDLSQIRITYKENQHAITGYRLYMSTGPHAQRQQVQWTHVLTKLRQNVSADGEEIIAGFSGIGRSWKLDFLHVFNDRELWCNKTYMFLTSQERWNDKVYVKNVDFFGTKVAVEETAASPGHWIAHAGISPEVREYTGSAYFKRGMSHGVTYIKSKTSTFWIPLGTHRYHNNWFVVLAYHVSYTMKKLRISNYGCDWNHDVKAFTLQVSNTSNPYSWTHVLTVNDVAANTSLPQYSGGFSASGRYWMVTVTATYSGWEPWMRVFHLFGIKDSPYLCNEVAMGYLDGVIHGPTSNHTNDVDGGGMAMGTVIENHLNPSHIYDVMWNDGNSGQYVIGDVGNTRRIDLFPAGYGCRRDVVPNIMLPLKADICCVPSHLNWNPEPELSGLQCSNTASCRVCGSMTGNSCGCDKACRIFGDCCHNYQAACGDDVRDNEDIRPVIQPDSCRGRCNIENIVSKVTCNCTSSCNMTETCCDDFEDVCQGEKDHGTGASDVNISATEGSQPLQCVAPWNFRSHFWMVASCPPSYADSVVRGLCETSYENNDMFLHAPVTDNSTNTNYRNIFCALCNKARYMVGWKMVNKCGYTPLDPLKTILQDKDDICNHYFRPTVAPARLCFPPNTTPPRASVRCDVAKCRNITAVFYANAIPFRNSACAECYADEYDLFDSSCKADESIFIGFLGTITVLFDYSNILQSKMSSSELEVFDHTESCSVGFIYDPFRDNCRKISFVPPKEVRKDVGVKEVGDSLENDPYGQQALTPSPIEDGVLPTQSPDFPQQSATFLVINTVSGASAVVSILYLLSGLRHFARAESTVKICLLTCLLLAQVSQLVGQVVPSAACCTAMLVCTLCFCLAASLSLTATIQHLSVLQRGGTCTVTCHLLVIVLIPLSMSGGYIALDDSIRMEAPRPLTTFQICWIDDPVKMAITMVVPALICTLVDLYYLIRMSVACATANDLQYSFLAQGALLFLPFTVAMTTGVLTAYFDSDLLRMAFLYMPGF
ncbi:ENPP1 [Branchiostoma lanceolatum]|uniref:ENPP1 protein n=1 Tax=Branchiostoma lanceolatum TaxID=7740 RepID=A0A8K0E918_BRALA|nr:ENPP1 [Branchiostoma lanceolatum]